jgi:hypothetical protein
MVRARTRALWSVSLLILGDVTVKMNTFNPMKHEVYANNTSKYSFYITENIDFQLQGLADRICSAK